MRHRDKHPTYAFRDHHVELALRWHEAKREYFEWLGIPSIFEGNMPHAGVIGEVAVEQYLIFHGTHYEYIGGRSQIDLRIHSSRSPHNDFRRMMNFDVKTWAYEKPLNINRHFATVNQRQFDKHKDVQGYIFTHFNTETNVLKIGGCITRERFAAEAVLGREFSGSRRPHEDPAYSIPYSRLNPITVLRRPYED